MSIGDRLKAARLRANLTQAELAAKIGLTKGSIGNYEQGISFPNVTVLSQLLEALQIDANYVYQDYVCSASAVSAVPEDERLLLDAFRKLNPPARERALLLVQDMAGNPACVEEAKEKAI